VWGFAGFGEVGVEGAEERGAARGGAFGEDVVEVLVVHDDDEVEAVPVVGRVDLAGASGEIDAVGLGDGE